MSNALFCIAVLICLVVLLANQDRIQKYVKEPFRINIAITMFIISFLMSTPISLFVWVMIKQMKTLQFPWRFISFILPFGAVVMVYAFDLMAKIAKEKVIFSGYRVLYYSIAALFGLLVYVDVQNIFRWYWVSAPSFLRHSMHVVWQNKEYHPNLTGDPNWESIDYGRDFSPVVASSNPFCDVNILKWLSHDRLFQVTSGEAHNLRLRTFYFPGWNVYLDGRQASISIDPKTGAMNVSIPPGKHEIAMKFELIPLRKNATYISFAAFALYVYLLLKLFPKKQLLLETKETIENNEEPQDLKEASVV